MSRDSTSLLPLKLVHRSGLVSAAATLSLVTLGSAPAQLFISYHCASGGSSLRPGTLRSLSCYDTLLNSIWHIGGNLPLYVLLKCSPVLISVIITSMERSLHRTRAMQSSPLILCTAVNPSLSTTSVRDFLIVSILLLTASHTQPCPQQYR